MNREVYDYEKEIDRLKRDAEEARRIIGRLVEAMKEVKSIANAGWQDCVTGAADASSPEAEAFERITRIALAEALTAMGEEENRAG